MLVSNSPRLWTALITPFKEDLSIDFESLERLLLRQQRAKLGVLLCGSTGEALNLSLEKKKSIIDFSLSLKLKIPYMIGVGGHLLEEQIKWIQFLEKYQSIHSYLLVTPLYSKPGPLGQTAWFKSLLSVATKPSILYNIPSRTGVELAIQTVQELNTHPLVWGIKEASGEPHKFSQYQEALSNGIIFSGDDMLMKEFSKRGAFGLISVASNIWPERTQDFLTKCLEQTLNTEDNQKFVSCFSELFKSSNPLPTKALLAYKKIIKTYQTIPPLTSTDFNSMSSLLKWDSWITNLKGEKK